MEAVKRDGTILQFIGNQTPELVMAAINQNPEAIKYAKI